MSGYDSSNVELNGGETYFIILSGEGEKFDFTISPVSQIQSFEIVNPELLSGVRIIKELADDDYAFSYILQDLRFKVSYTDLEGNIVTDTIGFYDDNDVIGSINISYDKGDYEDPSTQVGKKTFIFIRTAWKP